MIVDADLRLPFFPVAADGEAVFSVVGRCLERLGIASSTLLKILTGQKRSTTLFSTLPGYLINISKAVPVGHPWVDVAYIIKSNTALPYYTYFHAKEQRSCSQNLLAEVGNGHPVALGLGLSTYRTPALASTLRFCVSCLEEQYRTLGHSYFKVAHQLPAVTHCWLHGSVLSHGCVTCGTYPMNGKALTMPGQCLCSSFVALPVGELEAHSESAIWLARESAYLLSASESEDDRRQCLRKGVIEAGICRGAMVDYDLLAEAIETRFGEDFLTGINHPVRDEDGRPSAWIRRALPGVATTRRLPSIVGLLILGSAFDSVADFEANRTSSSSEERATFVKVPPLRNTPEKWASNLRETLERCQYRISACAARLNKTSWAIALEARRQGIEIPLTPQVVKRIGSFRLNLIRTLLREGFRKNFIIATQGISEWTLNLIELDNLSLCASYRESSKKVRRDRHRKKILDFIGKNPSATRRTISAKLSGAYDYIISNDKEWFYEVVPKASKRLPFVRSDRKDWGRIDRNLADAVAKTADEMLSSCDRPVRVTISLLLKKNGAIQKFHSKRSSLPITAAVLEGRAESSEEFLVRKVRWAIRELMKDDPIVSMDLLRRKVAMPVDRLKESIEVVRKVLEEEGAIVSERSVLSKKRSKMT